jgi:hypothetical protein
VSKAANGKLATMADATERLLRQARKRDRLTSLDTRPHAPPEGGAVSPEHQAAAELLNQARAHGAVVILDDTAPDGFAIVAYAPKRDLFRSRGGDYEAELRRHAPAVLRLLQQLARRDDPTAPAVARDATATPADTPPGAAPPSRKLAIRQAVARVLRLACRGRLPKRDDPSDRAELVRDRFARGLYDFLKPRPDKGEDPAAAREKALAAFVGLSGMLAAKELDPRRFRLILRECRGLKPGGRAIHFRAKISPLMKAANASVNGQEAHSATLLRLAEGLECFRSPDGHLYATLTVNGHRETHDLASTHFRRWITREFYRDRKAPPSMEAFQGAMQVLEARAAYDGPERPVSVRVAPAGPSAFYLDLGNADWSAVRVDAQGWTLSTDPPEKFRRPSGMLPLPIPQPGGELIADLNRFANVAIDDAPLLVAWITAALLPTGPYPLLVLTGEQGSAKSTLAKFVRRLIDPHVSELRAEPKELRDLMIGATNSWVCCWDNFSKITTSLSDTLCRLSTGGGFATRQLCTDTDEVFLDAQRPVILTAIDDVVNRTDLSERALFLRLPTIADRDRRLESALLAEFDRTRPRLLGSILDAVAAGLKTRDQVKLKSLPRMADFARWGEAVCRAIGYPPNAFLERYATNRRDAYATLLDGSPLVTALESLAERGPFQGTPQSLLVALNDFKPPMTSPQWPRTARALGSQLRRLAPAIRSGGVNLTFGLGRYHREVALQLGRKPAE